MASRRIKMLTNNNYVQPLKLCFKNKMIISPGSAYNSIVTKYNHKACNGTDLKIQSWAKFDAENFDGIQVFAGLFKKGFKSAASCTFRIYSISVDDNWTETLLSTQSGVSLGDGRFRGIFNEASLNPAEQTGEITFKLEVELIRLGKSYSETYFFNHLGIYGSFIRLSQEVDFLSITKKDL
ncbi:hypothetical protein EBZ38_05940 [bacterium]|nr:hypothetical protein [bacterium]